MRENNKGHFTFWFSFDEVELRAAGGQHEEDGGEGPQLHAGLTSPAGSSPLLSSLSLFCPSSPVLVSNKCFECSSK